MQPIPLHCIRKLSHIPRSNKVEHNYTITSPAIVAAIYTWPRHYSFTHRGRYRPCNFVLAAHCKLPVFLILWCCSKKKNINVPHSRAKLPVDTAGPRCFRIHFKIVGVHLGVGSRRISALPFQPIMKMTRYGLSTFPLDYPSMLLS